MSPVRLGSSVTRGRSAWFQNGSQNPPRGVGATVLQEEGLGVGQVLTLRLCISATGSPGKRLSTRRSL